MYEYDRPNWRDEWVNSFEPDASKRFKELGDKLIDLKCTSSIEINGPINIMNLQDVPCCLWENVTEIEERVGEEYTLSYHCIFYAKYEIDGWPFRFSWEAALYYQGTSLDTCYIIAMTKNVKDKKKFVDLLERVQKKFSNIKEELDLAQHKLKRELKELKKK